MRSRSFGKAQDKFVIAVFLMSMAGFGLRPPFRVNPNQGEPAAAFADDPALKDAANGGFPSGPAGAPPAPKPALRQSSGQAEAGALPDLAGVAPEIVATVNGKPLTRDQLAALAVGVYGTQLLETLISQEVVRQEAVKQGLSVTQDEVATYTKKRAQEQLDEMARKMGAKDAADLTSRAGKSPDSLDVLRKNAEAVLRPFIGSQLLGRKLMARNIQVPDADLRAEFERRYGAKAKVLQIVVRNKADAEEIIRKLKMGADFGQLARDVSLDAVSRRAGGEMPPLSRGSPLGDAAFGLKPGEISDVVATPDGFHVIKLRELLSAADVKFESVKDKLRQEIMDRLIAEQREKWADDLLGKADIKRTLQP